MIARWGDTTVVTGNGRDSPWFGDNSTWSWTVVIVVTDNMGSAAMTSCEHFEPVLKDASSFLIL